MGRRDPGPIGYGSLAVRSRKSRSQLRALIALSNNSNDKQNWITSSELNFASAVRRLRVEVFVRSHRPFLPSSLLSCTRERFSRRVERSFLKFSLFLIFYPARIYPSRIRREKHILSVREGLGRREWTHGEFSSLNAQGSRERGKESNTLAAHVAVPYVSLSTEQDACLIHIGSTISGDACLTVNSCRSVSRLAWCM